MKAQGALRKQALPKHGQTFGQSLSAPMRRYLEVVKHREQLAPGVVRGEFWQPMPDGRVQCERLPTPLPHARRAARVLFRAGSPGRRGRADQLRTSLWLLHRPDRKKAVQPLLPRQQRALVRNRRLQPWLSLLSELGHLQGTRATSPDRQREPHDVGRRGPRRRLPQHRVHLQRSRHARHTSTADRFCCRACHRPLAGRFSTRPGTWGARRLRLPLHERS
jgi:hypothetical protein